MDTGTPHNVEEHHVHQRHFDRLVMLSDGVFAIALTLSAVELHPEGPHGQGLLQMWAKPLAVYFLSFFLIGVVWLRHRRTLAHLYRVDGLVTATTLVLLSLVALVPVVVRFALTYPQREGAFLVYALAFAVLYLGLAMLWGYLAFVAKLASHATPAEARQLLAKLCFAVAVFVAAAMFQLGWMVAAGLCVLLALPLRWLAWRQGRGPSAAG